VSNYVFEYSGAVAGQKMKRFRYIRGFTLAEAMISVVILSIASCGLLLPFTSGMSVRAEGKRRTMAAKLSGDIIETIISSDFDNIVATYDGYTESAGQLRSASGEILTGEIYGGLSRVVNCDYIYVGQEKSIGSSNFILITATVSYNDREIASVNRLVSRSD
jgi:prepilin-type N-terminal cleavage/methylation domain-containing protein